MIPSVLRSFWYCTEIASPYSTFFLSFIQLRVFWYMMNRLSEDEAVQMSGISNVVYNNGGFPRQGMDYEKSRRFSYMFRAIPIRFCNYFVCIDDKPWLTVVETFAVIITRFLRVRLRMLRGKFEGPKACPWCRLC